MPVYHSHPDPSLVSAVIPTRGRPELLACAVRSALRQTWPHMEVVVVVDGPDSQSELILRSITDPRLRVVLLPAISGGSTARNAGVHAARGEWIAFLDDDDEWLPEKIERQMRAVWQMPDWFPVISCRLIAQSPSASRVLPLRTYEASEPLGDYLFARHGFADPGGMMQTSTLLAPRELLVAVPFRDGLPMHQDWDWLLRVASHRGVRIAMLAQPLSIWRIEDGRETVGRGRDWRASLEWIRQMRRLISPRAFSWFVAIQCGWRAQRNHAGPSSRFRLLRAFLFEGCPEWRSFQHLLVFSLIPPRVRRSARNRVCRNSGWIEAASGLHLVFARKPLGAALRPSSR